MDIITHNLNSFNQQINGRLRLCVLLTTPDFRLKLAVAMSLDVGGWSIDVKDSAEDSPFECCKEE